MSFSKIFIVITIILFGLIGVAAMVKRESIPSVEQTADSANHREPVTVALIEEEVIKIVDPVRENERADGIKVVKKEEKIQQEISERRNLPDANRINELFNKREPRLPIIETITYKSRTSWLKGRPAWIADYASHYNTSRHFIARSLNGKSDYDKQDIVDGECFNVFREGKNLEFYLIVDVKLSKMWFYYYDKDSNERVLLKTYPVGLGRYDENLASGSLTPLGKYTLGDKVAVYQPKTMAHHRGKKVDMVSIFGTRWIPFDLEIDGCTASPKGLGIHGLPLQCNERGEFIEDLNSLGKNESDGCIRLATKDIEEIYAIIITKPTTIELVESFHQATPPGKERAGECPAS